MERTHMLQAAGYLEQGPRMDLSHDLRRLNRGENPRPVMARNSNSAPAPRDESRVQVQNEQSWKSRSTFAIRECRMANLIMLKPQDVVVCLKLLLVSESQMPVSYASLAQGLRLSPSEVHSAVTRAVKAGLLRKPLPGSGRTMPEPVRRSLAEFLTHGLKYVWPAERGAVTRGIPTCSSYEPVANDLNMAAEHGMIIWEHPDGQVRGEAIEPLYRKALDVCLTDPSLYRWLAMIDSVRIRTGREAAIASAWIEQKLR